MALVQFRSGLAASYNGLATKDINTFYYTTDDKQLYLGDVKLSDYKEIAAAVAAIEANDADILKLQQDLDALIGTGTSGSISDMLSALETKLQKNIDANTEAIEANDGDIAQLHADLTAETSRAEQAEGALDQAIEALETKVNDNKTDIEGKMTALTTRVGTAEGTIAGHTTSIESLEAADEAIEGRLDALEAADTQFGTDLDAVEAKVSTLVGEDANKSVREIAAEELAEQLIPDTAAESLDTLTEIAAWIQAHPDNVATMNAAIQANAKAIEDLEGADGALQQNIDKVAGDLTTLAGRVTTAESDIDKLEAKDSENLQAAKDYADAAVAVEKERAEGVEAGLRTDVNAAAAGVEANETAIAAINNAETGILAQARAKIKELKDSLGTAAYKNVEYFEQDAQTKADAALASAKTYADGVGTNTLNSAKAHAAEVAGTAESNAKAYTDDKLTWKAIG